jgi:NAD(P)H-hydrate epimerase
MNQKQTRYFYTTMDDMAGKIRKRKRFSHKGSYGHALLIAGSYGMTGAAILSAGACIRAGAGLLTTHLPAALYPIVQTAVPESIFSIDRSEDVFSRCPPLDKYSAVAAGPGLGVHFRTKKALDNLIRSAAIPIVLDADGLNILAVYPEMRSILPAETIITPHPGEFDRLFGRSENGQSRNQLQIEMSRKYKIVIVLKGAFTSVTLPDGQCFFNSTGNPGMATAGSGDVLTGILLSLLTQGYPSSEAAVAGTFIHGLAGDLSAEEHSQQGLIASDIIQNIGKAFKKVESHEINPLY